MSLKDRTVGVMMGGLSSASNVSLKSGSAVLEALRTAGLNAVALEVIDETYEGIKSLIESNGVNVVFVAMHGEFGEDGTVQKILDDMNLPHTGSGVRASALGMDKIRSRQIFKSIGLAVPGFKPFSQAEGEEGALEPAGVPSSWSAGVYRLFP